VDAIMVYLFLDRENGEISISLVKMNTTIPYFGIGDLIEVLGRLAFSFPRDSCIKTVN
jgi:hypothetical protein